MKTRVTARLLIWTAVAVLILLPLIAFVHAALRGRDISKEDPRKVFYWLVSNRMPTSVSGLKAHGDVRFTGHSVEMEFQLAAADFPRLLADGAFHSEVEQNVPDGWFKEAEAQFAPLEFYRKQGGAIHPSGEIFLAASVNHDRVFLRYFRP